MLPFIFIYSLLGLCACISLFSSSQIKNYLFYTGAVFIVAFIAFRDESVGTDTTSYVNSFMFPEMGYGKDGADFGFQILLYIIHFLTDNKNVFIFITGILGIWGILYLIKKASDNPPMSLFLFSIIATSHFFLFHYMSAIRQSLAESLFLVALYLYLGEPNREMGKIPNLETDVIKKGEQTDDDSIIWGIAKDRFIAACILLIIGISIHGTLLIVVPFIILARIINFNKITWAILIVTTYLLGSNHFFSVQDIFFKIFSLLGDTFFFIDKYAHYGNVNFGEITLEKNFVNPYSWPFTLITLLLLFKSQKFHINCQYTKLFLFGVCLNNAFSDNLMWGRLFSYFIILIVILLPNIMEYKKNIITYGAYFVIFAFYIYKSISQLLWQMIFTEEGNIVCPYDSYLISFF